MPKKVTILISRANVKKLSPIVPQVTSSKKLDPAEKGKTWFPANEISRRGLIFAPESGPLLIFDLELSKIC